VLGQGNGNGKDAPTLLRILEYIELPKSDVGNAAASRTAQSQCRNRSGQPVQRKHFYKLLFGLPPNWWREVDAILSWYSGSEEWAEEPPPDGIAAT
jgi:hypothetical protein